MIAIGPHHHDKDLLLAFEEHKISYLQTLIKRTVIPYPDYVRAMWELEEGARNCYGGSISLDKDDFVQMMLFDGCFIVEVIRKFRLPELRGEDDPIFKLGKGCPRDDLYQVDVYPITKVKHLVDLAHNNWLPSPAGIEAYRNNGTKNSDWTFIYSATEI
ncbi:hypothetical protein WN943_029482 [Citrus x changshan-huyou]